MGGGASQRTQWVKNRPAVQETQVRSLGQEDPLEEGMATHSNNLAWRIPWTEEPGGLQSIGSQSLTQLKPVSLHTCTHLFFGCVALPSQLDIKFSSLSLKRFDTILLSSGIVTEDYSQSYFCSLMGFIFLFGEFWGWKWH